MVLPKPNEVVHREATEDVLWINNDVSGLLCHGIYSHSGFFCGEKSNVFFSFAILISFSQEKKKIHSTRQNITDGMVQAISLQQKDITIFLDTSHEAACSDSMQDSLGAVLCLGLIPLISGNSSHWWCDDMP